MNNDFRSRVIMPIVLPILVLVTIAAVIGAIALSLLFNTHEGSLMLAAVAAAGILFTVSLASSHDRLTPARRGVLVLAGALPVLVGGAFAAGVVGGIDDEARMVNVEPLLSVPDDAPVIAAENSVEFCLPDGEGGCAPMERWEVTPSTEEINLSYLFDNREAGVPHNVVITDLAGSVDDPSGGDETFASSTVIEGLAEDYFVSEEYTWDELPEDWYFFCAIHPIMQGTGTVVAGEA